MNVAAIVVRWLAKRGITHAFLVQGAANNDLIYAIADCPGSQYVSTMHEQAAGFAAEGWAKVKGLPGLAIATSGPGGQNLITPIANCYYDSVPCIFITGQVMTKFQRPAHGPGSALRQVGFQEWPIVDVVKPITKWAVMLRDPAAAVDVVRMAYDIALAGRPGPVVLDIPIDVQRTKL